MMDKEIIEKIKTYSRAHFSLFEVTPEEIRNFAKGMIKLIDEPILDVDEIFNMINELHSVTVAEPNILKDDIGHIEWFNESTNLGIDRDISWHFWDHFKNYLLIKKSPPRENKIVDKLDQISSLILGRMEDAHRDGPWDRRGMVVGNVQAGKTENYTGVLTKAADAGYKLIIILTGGHENLRCQAQLRLNEEFIGYDIGGQDERIIGVRQMFKDHNKVFTLTTRAEKGDFSKRVMQGAYTVPTMESPPFLLITKKSTPILKNIIAWTDYFSFETQEGRKIVKDIPLLLIDDECDYASVNTKKTKRDTSGKIKDDWDPSATNKLIRELLHRFEKKVYLAYTATPYANIFIKKNNYHPKYGEDLYPRHFLINLPQSQNYLGAETLFGLEGDEDQDIEEVEALPLIRDVKDNEPVIPSKHNKKYNIIHIPDSLKNALKSFILTCAARRIRSNGIIHNSMLIHVTLFRNLQDSIEELVRTELTDLSARIMSGIDQLEDFKFIWGNDFEKTTERMFSLGYETAVPISWEKIKIELHEAVRLISIKKINGEAVDVLDYREKELASAKKEKNGEKLHWGEKGAHVIAIGGNKLSRGLTLEGLSISYYLRASSMYDTLMQMGRWFGYRVGYEDLCRIYTTIELQNWYSHIARANIELKKEFEKMESIKATPEDFGVKVLNHPERLAITSTAKSRDTKKIKLSFAGTSPGTLTFDEKFSKNNFKSLINMIEVIGRPPENINDVNKRGYLWNKLSPDLIIDFLKGYKYSEDEIIFFDPSRIAKFIEGQIPNGELTEWTLFIASKKENVFKKHKVKDLEVSCTERAPVRKIENGIISLKGIRSPKDEYAYLSKDSEKKIKKEHEIFNEDKAKKDKISLNRFILQEKRSKKQGVLIIYIIANKDKQTKVFPHTVEKYGINEPVTAFFVGFPVSQTAKAIVYTVPDHYFDEEMDL